jgi:hypothetical protein
MQHAEMRLLIFFRFALVVVLALAAVDARADLSSKQARKLITRMAGFDLPSSAVRVKKISSTSNSSAEATAEIQAAFRLVTNAQGRWRVAELRIGQDRWEELELVAGTPQIETSARGCDNPDLRGGSSAAIEPSTKRARCLIAALLGLQLPSDTVRVKTVSPLELPLASRPSAVVEALIIAELRFARDSKTGWVVTALSTGGSAWISPETLAAAANETKRNRARAELDSMTQALARFWGDRRSYVASESHAVLIDHLSPGYLSRVVRLDPWHEPYRYRGEPNTFTLRSLGEDRQENTGDDIVVSGPIRESSGQRP